MPKVGRRHFAYSPRGRKAAKKYATQTERKIRRKK
jgi:hypothetical protein